MSRRKKRRTSQRHRPAAGETVVQLPFQQLRNPYPPMEILSADELESIHEASLDLLERVGINFLLPEARDILAAAGADVEKDGMRVRFDRALVMSHIAHIPSEFTLHARNPEHSLVFGGNTINFSAVGSPPNWSDLVSGRQSGTYDAYCNFLRLTQCTNIAQLVAGHSVEPMDIETPVRHLDATMAMIELTDKIFRIYSLGRQRTLDVLAMVRILFGVDESALADKARVFTMINSNSPLQYDIPMLWGMIELARCKQPVMITPFTLAGAMAPVTLAGALNLQNAEALAGLAFVQMVGPGTPMMYGGFTSNVDMKSGSPAFGTPEYVKATLIGGQLARRYGVPYRSSNVNASNAPDAQATYESQMSIWASVLAHANFVHHGLGWLEGGLCASFEKFIIDAEMLQGMAEVLRPVSVTAADLAVDAIEAVGPGGHFFGSPHTMERYETAFYQPMLSDWRNFENWEEHGALDATQRAHRIYKQLLASYEQPPLEPAIKEELAAFVARRKNEGGAPMQ
ncbi:MAG: trimethylamine methyltransferase family protein [Gammaproteobacteria bacterium]|nr:trimethylamine methyltransferase family protein [Gammaproteobacteria bacterium]MDX2461276.1 trimethylamine methyltransferase family protein [Gammaproteobacteria bacterium]